MKINKLYSYAEENNIDIDYFTLRSTIALSIPGAIALNKSINTIAELTSCLAHELGHQATDTFYMLSSPFETRARAEERATRWAVNEILSAEDISKAVKNGYRELWQLANYFDVTEDFIRDAVRVHKLQGDL